MTRPPHRRRGYSLVEMVMVAGIVALVAAMASPLLIQAQRFFLLNRARVNIQREARATMASITKNLRQAKSNTIRIDNVAGQPYYSRLQFTTVNNQTYTYYQSGNNLHSVMGSTSTLSNHVRFLNFFLPRSQDLTIVSISLTLEELIYEGRTKALHVASERVRVMN